MTIPLIQNHIKHIDKLTTANKTMGETLVIQLVSFFNCSCTVKYHKKIMSN